MHSGAQHCGEPHVNMPVDVQERGRAPSAASIRLEEAIQRACARIAPTWPLDRFIAVNPFWELIDEPVHEVAATLRALSGAQLLMPRTWYRDAYREGLLRDEHLQGAIDRTGAAFELARLCAMLDEEAASLPHRARVVDVVDAGRDLVHEMAWRTFVTHNISQFCAAYFDDGQAAFRPADRQEGQLYASWWRHAQADRSPELLMRMTAYEKTARRLPETARELIDVALQGLCIPPSEYEKYLWSLLLDQNGWASWCAYLRWTAGLEKRKDDTITDLLAVRLAWEWILYQGGGDALARRWSAAAAHWTQVDALHSAHRRTDWLLQEAMEIAWREPILQAVSAGLCMGRPREPAVQAVFCIDVRSEVYRRALEGTSSSVQTLGFAGFFGIAAEYLPCGASGARPQLPGLLAPRLRVTDMGLSPKEEVGRANERDAALSWHASKTDPFSMFAFVEALGLRYAGSLLKNSFGLGKQVRADGVGFSPGSEARLKPRLTETVEGRPLALEDRCELAATILRGMSLTRDFSRLVLFAGHGSATRNNPHAAGLDCGACGGQTGEANARAVAALFNDVDVRAGLVGRGIHIPPSTWFLAGLHHTTTDDVELFDLDELPETHRGDVEVLRAWLAEASAHARSERAPMLGISSGDQRRVDRAIRARSTDWSEVRPEWGLANNAAFIAAPREHVRHLHLAGRAFLHEYRYKEDKGFRVLEQIMTAPMVVAHWINFQYYASTVDNDRYGSGNKVLHNVVGGHLGVFEGNGGDLRIGLPMQSLHDGSRWVHTPLRLSVFLEAPRPAIEAVLEKHGNVRSLVHHGWLALFQVDDELAAVHALERGVWKRENAPDACRHSGAG